MATLKPFLFFFSLFQCGLIEGFNVAIPPTQARQCHDFALDASSRREFLSEQAAAAVAAVAMATTTAGPLPVSAADDDLTSQLFNPDGSLKEGVESVAKFRSVDIDWDVAAAPDKTNVAMNAEVSETIADGGSGKVRVSYALPEKWEKKNGVFVDKAEQSKVLDHIYVYRSPKKAAKDTLQKATTTGVAKALDVIEELNALKTADLLNGRTEKREDLLYYNFDMALAPASCESSPENLGLGFCPYDTICLLSSTIVDDYLYVFAVDCNKSEWKAFNSDLKTLRSSFKVNSL